jgi:hypothetical protein
MALSLSTGYYPPGSPVRCSIGHIRPAGSRAFFAWPSDIALDSGRVAMNLTCRTVTRYYYLVAHWAPAVSPASDLTEHLWAFPLEVPQWRYFKLLVVALRVRRVECGKRRRRRRGKSKTTTSGVCEHRPIRLLPANAQSFLFFRKLGSY